MFVCVDGVNTKRKTNVTEPWTGFLFLCFVFSHVKSHRKIFFFSFGRVTFIFWGAWKSVPFFYWICLFLRLKKNNYFLLKIKMSAFAKHKISTVCMKINYKSRNPSTQTNIFCPSWSKAFETKSNLVSENFQYKTCFRM
jgi:hypothetical protein